MGKCGMNGHLEKKKVNATDSLYISSELSCADIEKSFLHPNSPGWDPCISLGMQLTKCKKAH